MKKQPINFDWQYTPDFQEAYIAPSCDTAQFTTVQIPHTNVELPLNNFDEKAYQFESCYRKELDIAPYPQDQEVYVRFEGVMNSAKVYFNGHLVGEHKGGYTPFRCNLTPYVKSPKTRKELVIAETVGEPIAESDLAPKNILVVHVDSRETNNVPPCGFVIDYLTYGGIYREVSLEHVNTLHVEHMLVKPHNVLTNPEVHVDLYFSKPGEDIRVECHLSKWPNHGQNNVQLYTTSITTASKNTISFPAKNITLWDTENPHLYTLEVRIIRGSVWLETCTERFGFREAVFKQDGFYLNGRLIKLRGLNRHQSFPYVGYAMPKNAQRKDADILKYELGLNTVRLSHYPQSNHFMDRCDEIGLLVFDEIPGWQHIGDKAWQDIAVENVREMILKDGNHPSVIIWGTRINESQDDHDFYQRTHTLAKSLDETRQTGGVRCIKKSELLEDVYTYNDFTQNCTDNPLSKKKAVTKTDKPYLVTEYNGHMFPTKKYDHESKRTAHANHHLRVVNAMMGDSNITGAIGWCMFDYNTHKDFGSGDKICYHGVMDMFRIPKAAAYAYSSQGCEEPVMYVANSLNIGEYAASLLEDIYVYTNCDYIDFYKNDELIKRFYPNKKEFPHLAHAPVLIDDFVGDAIEKHEKFSKKDAALAKNLLMNISKHGEKMSLGALIKMGYLLVKYRMNQRDAEDLYTKYFGGWGGVAPEYTFKGVKDGKEIIIKKGELTQPELRVSVDSDHLIEDDTYDVTRVVVQMVDNYGGAITYANDGLHVQVTGAAELIGPQHISLIGGSVGFWVRSIGESGTAIVRVCSDRFGTIERKVVVEKR